ncbi:hypothetical protein LOTGIDRAFT_154102 [Lottia gigantea]|uniref:DUF3456 domain-containing protein n=1 Tax=Lottia gigantea TaxID=225164 RepID=V3ZXC4_LOTGI|nr:hypothetical protein LOTGIDRAFT_154102 [Lottia gigantea]ESO89027.1 hypothetical protein LOTGIDRAFT_154102 [Lottia gigantea]
MEKSFQQVDVKSTSGDIIPETFDGSAGNLKFSSPSLPDDDDSIMLPKSVRCDGCLSLAYQIIEAFDKSHSKKKSVKILPETDVLDILDTLCSSKFDAMGLRNVDGVTKLSGPGLDITNQPGMIMSGGRWHQRMRYLCGNIVGEVGEEEIYDNYLFNRNHMGDVLCRGTGVTNSCIDAKNNRKNEKLKRKDEF